jgi:hypothetical protein
MTSEWPPQPYRGLNYFRPQDRPLLAGRDDDVVACSALLAHPETRVLLLHGSTGCGKSSFLRAGLIPTMEEEGAGYLFLKTAAADDEALFIRCGEAPVDRIAWQIFLFIREPFRLRTPAGWRELDLTSALRGACDWEAYLTLVRDEEGLLQSLRRVAEIIPQTLVLIVDQAEEVLTHNPGEENFENRVRFFAFLRDFQRLEFDARVIVTLRTEYFGRFIDAIQLSHRAGAEFQQFLLGELGRPSLVDAILRPTRREPIEPFGVPYAAYGFEFEEGLPATIVDDILGARYSSPALPILQLVCRGLYEGRDDAAIRAAEYASAGRVEGLVVRHITGAIQAIYEQEDSFRSDLEGIREFLGTFYTMQDDGSVVARTLEEAFVISELEGRRLRVPSDRLIAALAAPSTLILRRLRNMKADGRMLDEVTLGHDSVALALEHWKQLDAEERIRNIQRLRQAEVRELTVEVQGRQAEVRELTVEVREYRKQYFKLAKEITTNLGASLVTVVGVVAVTVQAIFTGTPAKEIAEAAVNLLRQVMDSTIPESHLMELFANILVITTLAIFLRLTFLRLVDDFSAWVRRKPNTLRKVLGPQVSIPLVRWANGVRRRQMERKKVARMKDFKKRRLQKAKRRIR